MREIPWHEVTEFASDARWSAHWQIVYWGWCERERRFRDIVEDAGARQGPLPPLVHGEGGDRVAREQAK